MSIATYTQKLTNTIHLIENTIDKHNELVGILINDLDGQFIDEEFADKTVAIYRALEELRTNIKNEREKTYRDMFGQ